MTLESGVNALNKLFVSVYKTVGFVLLTVIVAGLLSYLSLNGFFLVNRSWVASAVVSKNDERVLQLTAQLAAQSYQRDRLVLEREEVLARAEDARRVLAAEESFQQHFAQALKVDVSARIEELRRTNELQQLYAVARDQIGRSGDQYTRLWRDQASSLLAARLIGEEQAVAIDQGLSQIARDKVTMLEKEVEIQTRRASLLREIDALLTARKGALKGSDGRSLTYDGLQKGQQLVRSILESEKMRDQLVVLEKSVATVDRAIEDYDKILGVIREAPYFKATDGHLTVAFVPYENLNRVAVGAPLFGCLMSFLWCRAIGQVVGMLDGEVVSKHPLSDRPMRGLLVETQLTEPGWEKENVLYASRPPMLF